MATTPKTELAKYTTQSQMSSFFTDKLKMLSVTSYGAVGDGTTDDTTAFSNAISDAETNGRWIMVPEGTYKITSTLTCNTGISFIGIGPVGAMNSNGPIIQFDHTSDGIVWNGNYTSSAQGVGTTVQNIHFHKGASKNGGIGLKFVTTDDSHTPGWIKLIDVRIQGATASEGEGLFTTGIKIDGTNGSIGLKNVSMRNVVVTGCSTNYKYIDIIDAVQVHWTDGYVYPATASFPSAGTCGITIDSDTVTYAATADLIHFCNVRLLGDYQIGEVTHIYFSNCFCSTVTFTSTGAALYWNGGEIANGKPSFVSGNSCFVNFKDYNSADMDVVNVTSSTALDVWDTNTLYSNDGATTDINIELPAKSTFQFTFVFINVEPYNLKIYPCPIADSDENFENMSDGKYINVQRFSHLKVWNAPDASGIKWKVIKGYVSMEEYTHATATGYAYNYDNVSNVKDLTGNINFTTIQGETLILNSTAARTITPVNDAIPPGYELLINNVSTAANNITFDSTGLNLVIGSSGINKVFYNGTAWQQLI